MQRMDLHTIIEALAGLHVLVIGEAMLDSYLEGSAGALCREAPVPVVRVASRTDAPGGAANTAANARGLGCQVSFLSVIGNDAEGERLRDALAGRGVDTGHLLVQPGRRTLAKQRVAAESHLLVRFDQGDTGPLGGAIERELIERLSDLFPRCDGVIVSDYGYGLLSPRAIKALERLQARTPRIIVADAKDLTAYRRAGITAAKPNYAEAVRLLGLREVETPGARAEQIAAHADALLDRTGAQIVAVTLDTDGALMIARGQPPYRTYAQPAQHSRAAGAGDTFCSALGLALMAGAEHHVAAELASAAAAVVVEKDGTAVCDARTLSEHVLGGDKYLADLERLAERLDFYRQQGRSVVFTNGCFDIIHQGHVTCLSRAKALGDVLIVGVNSDESVRRRKGQARPINTLAERVQVLAALSCVDAIVTFEDDTPHELIRAIRPDVFAKGGDYTRETLPEAPLVESLGGAVEILPYVDERSTTGIIERILMAYPPAEQERTVGESYAASANGHTGRERR